MQSGIRKITIEFRLSSILTFKVIHRNSIIIHFTQSVSPNPSKNRNAKMLLTTSVIFSEWTLKRGSWNIALNIALILSTMCVCVCACVDICPLGVLCILHAVNIKEEHTLHVFFGTFSFITKTIWLNIYEELWMCLRTLWNEERKKPSACWCIE